MRTNRQEYAVYLVLDRHDWDLLYLGTLRGGRHLDRLLTDDLYCVEERRDEERPWRKRRTLLGDKFADLFAGVYRSLEAA